METKIGSDFTGFTVFWTNEETNKQKKLMLTKELKTHNS